MLLVSSEHLIQLESYLSGCADRLLANRGLPLLSAALKEYVLSPGKRIRPQLTVWSYLHSKDERNPSADGAEGASSSGPGAAVTLPEFLLDLACVWELFHAFLLAHDDIIDGSETRRFQPALHKRLAELDSGSAIFGSHLAIVGGDLLFTAALELLHAAELPADRFRPVLQLFSRVATTTGFGQAIDIVQGHTPLGEVNEEHLLREYHWKTAAYTFEGPILSGAIAAGATLEAQAALSRFALALGQAYQLQNDLVDLAAPIHPGSDLVQGKRTITLCRARAGLPAEARPNFDAELHESMHGNLAVAEMLRARILASPASHATRRLVTSLLGAARDASADGAITPRLRGAMNTLLDELSQAYFL